MPALRSGLLLATSTLTVLAGAVIVAASPAAAATGCRTGANDFDGNGGTEVAIAAPGTTRTPTGVSSSVGDVEVKMRTAGGVRTVRIPPPSPHVYDFGRAIAELDLSDHSDPAVPCAALAIRGAEGENEGNAVGRIYLYTWNAATQDFALLNTIRPADAGAGVTNIGYSLAAPTLPDNRPAPRQPVLYTQAYESDANGKVVRLTLTPGGTVASSETISPAPSATDQMPLTTADASQFFGLHLLGTPDPDQVIISDPGAKVNGHQFAGAVVVWNRSARRS